MHKLKLGYIKKALVFPLVVVALLVVVTAIAVPSIISSLPTSTNSTYVAKEHDNSKYIISEKYNKKFDTFKDLQLNRFIGWVVSEDIGIDCAITYNSESEGTDAASLLPESTEPWNNGCMFIIGDNSDDEFRNLHTAIIGDTLTVEINNYDTYKYKISKVVVNQSRDEIFNYKKDNAVILCRPYKNFEEKSDDSSDDYFYAVYVADLVQE